MSALPPTVTNIPAVPADLIAAAPVAEDGKTTSEYAGKCAIQVIFSILGLVTAFGHGLSVGEQTAILGTAGSLVSLLEAAYSVSRGLRKAGTNG